MIFHGSGHARFGSGHRREKIANPYAMVMSGQMLLSWLANKKQDPDARKAAQNIQRAVEKVLDEMNAVTPDLGGQGSTSGMGDAICQALG